MKCKIDKLIVIIFCKYYVMLCQWPILSSF